jgi:ABC transport system ATP-binding/permease protein
VGGWEVLKNFYLDFTIAIMAGAMLGLMVSAIAPNQGMAPLLMILVLVPQIIFSGGIQPANNFGPPGQILNRINVIKWPFELLVTHSGLGRDVAEDSCFNIKGAEREALTEAQLNQCKCVGPNLFKSCRFPGIATKYVPAIN